MQQKGVLAATSYMIKREGIEIPCEDQDWPGQGPITHIAVV